MLNKHTFCRINGYAVSIDKFDAEECNISSSDYNTCIALNMEIIDRGWYAGTVKYSAIDCIWAENNLCFYATGLKIETFLLLNIMIYGRI